MDDDGRARNADNNNEDMVVAPVVDDRRRNNDDAELADDDDDEDDEGSVRSESTAGTEEDPADVIPLDNEGGQVQGMNDDDVVILSVNDTEEYFTESLPDYVSVSQDMIASIRQFSKPELRRLSKLVAASCDKPVTSLSIDLNRNEHDLRTAKRVTKILRGLDWRELQEFKLDFGEEGNAVHPMKALIVDHYLTFLLLNVTSVEQLTNVRMPFLGTNDVVWSSFFERFTSIDRLGVGVHWRGSGTTSRRNASGIIRRLRQLPSLPHLSLHLNMRNAPICTTTLFQAVAQLHCLQSLDVDVNHNGVDHKDMEAAINGAHGIVALSSTLRWLQVRVSREPTPPGMILFETDWCDGCDLLDSALHSTSITDLRLFDMALGDSKIGPEEAVTNESVKSLVIRNCDIGASAWAMINRFRGLESFELDGFERGQHYHKAWSEMLTALPRLSAFTDFVYLRNHCRDRSLTTFVSHVACAPALVKLRLATAAGDRRQGLSRLLPSLSNLMQHVKGTLELRHTDVVNDAQASDSNLGYIRSGIELSRDLKKLDLEFVRSSLTATSITAFLMVLQRHQFIEAFNGSFGVASGAPWDPHCLDSALFNLISMNTVLQSFRLRVYVTDEEGDLLQLGKVIRDAVYRGLEHNQTLKVLNLAEYSSGEDETRTILAALQRNVTLEHIKYHYPSDVSDSVAWLLTLNRYKRRLLVNPSAVPRGYWLSVFERIVKDDRSDVLYHFSRKLLPLLQQKARSGVKRESKSESEDVH